MNCGRAPPLGISTAIPSSAARAGSGRQNARGASRLTSHRRSMRSPRRVGQGIGQAAQVELQVVEDPLVRLASGRLATQVNERSLLLIAEFEPLPRLLLVRTRRLAIR